ncbi:hypothetical protein [Halomarina ordinaria]|uniref:Uncharacterized protein n=1 Tax=Halomarina ordinaria TaxID=3033939 RepID=A0ABD5U6H6_9EURY|nr:hypothetical protein [Halomarina sp. PSRA2]
MALTKQDGTKGGTSELRDPEALPPQRECSRCGGDRFYVYGQDGERPHFACTACGGRTDGADERSAMASSSFGTLVRTVTAALPLVAADRRRD